MSVPLNLEQPHFRKLIRRAVLNLLKDHVMVERKVYCSRPLRIFLVELPVVLIYFTDEIADATKTYPRWYKRRLTLVTEVIRAVDTERENALDDYLDSRAFEIEHAICDIKVLGLEGIVEDVMLMRTETINLSAEGDREMASLRIFWEITYNTDFNYQGELEEFLKFNSKYQLGNGASAEDEVTIRTQ